MRTQSGERSASRGLTDDDDDDGRLYDPGQLRVLPAYDTKELETLEYPLPELGE